jgi:hypothetical protein
MKKAIMHIITYMAVVLSSPFKTVSAYEPRTSDVRRPHNEANPELTSVLYNHIDFGSAARLSYEVFNKAYQGFINLRNAGKLNTLKEIITICDFSLSSSKARLWIIDLKNKKVLFNTWVAHGRGSGGEYANAFSNNSGSHQSSIGFYVTAETYPGVHGTSLRLLGMDKGYNDAASDRGIVVHGADYVSEKIAKDNDFMGRSWGCPAVPANLSGPIINTIKDGTCLFIYYPQKDYLQASAWLNKKISGVPARYLS